MNEPIATFLLWAVIGGVLGHFLALLVTFILDEFADPFVNVRRPCFKPKKFKKLVTGVVKELGKNSDNVIELFRIEEGSFNKTLHITNTHQDKSQRGKARVQFEPFTERVYHIQVLLYFLYDDFILGGFLLGEFPPEQFYSQEFSDGFLIKGKTLSVDGIKEAFFKEGISIKPIPQDCTQKNSNCANKCSSDGGNSGIKFTQDAASPLRTVVCSVSIVSNRGIFFKMPVLKKGCLYD